MSRIFSQTALAVAFAAVLVLPPSHLAGQQPTPEAGPPPQRGEGRGQRGPDEGPPQPGRRGAARGRGAAIPGEMSAAPQLQRVPTLPFGEGVINIGDAPQSDLPKIPVTLEVWAVTLSVSKEKANNDLQAGALSKSFASVRSADEIRALVARLAAAGVVERCREFSAQATNGQIAFIQSGANTPQVVATATMQQIRTNSVAYTPIGTIVQMLPRLDPDGNLQVSISYNSSEIEKSKDIVLSEPANGEKLFADRTVQYLAKTDVHLKLGSAKLVQSDVSTQPKVDGESFHMQLLLLAASKPTD